MSCSPGSTEKTDPAADGRLDLYATALHELVHTLGMTTANVPIYIGTNAQGELIGENVTAVYGGPVPASGGHVAQNVESVVWGSDGIVSEALLDPNSLRGVRKYLTELDAALGTFRDRLADALETQLTVLKALEDQLAQLGDTPENQLAGLAESQLAELADKC